MSLPAHRLEVTPADSSLAERIIFDHRPMVLILCLIASALLGYQASMVRLNASFDKSVPTRHPYVTNAAPFQPDLQGLNNFLRIAVSTNGTIFDAAYLETLRRINEEVFLLPGVDRSYMKSLWMSSVRWTGFTEEGYEGGPVIPDDYDGSTTAIAKIRANIERSGEIGNLVAADYRSTILFVPLLERDFSTGAVLDYGSLNRSLERIRAKYETDSIRLHITGFAKIAGDLIDGLHDLLLFFIAAILVSAALLYNYTRCLRSTLLVTFCSLLAVVWLLGFLHLSGDALDPYSILVPFVIFAIGIGHGAQKTNGIAQDIGRGIHKLMAARRTFRRLFLPALTGLLTDAAGFAVLMIIPIVAIQQLALAASIGVVGLIFTNLILLPVLLSYFGVNPRAAERSVRGERNATMRDERIRQVIWHGVVLLTRRRHAAVVLGVAGAFAVACLMIGSNLKVGDLDPGAPELRADSRYNRDDAFIAKNYATGSDILVAMVRTPEAGCTAYETLRKVDDLEWELRQLQSVTHTRALSDVSKSAAVFMNEGFIKWHDIPGDPQTRNNIAARPSDLRSPDCDTLYLHVHLRDHRADTLQQVTKTVESFAARVDTSDVQFVLGSGNAAIHGATNDVIKKANLPMRVLIFSVVIALCMMTFRSWRAALCAVLPLALTAILCEALMTKLKIGVKVATLPVVALGVGIGVDYALYLLSVTLSGMRHGMALAEAYYRALLFTGKVVALAGLVLATSLATWNFSPIKFQVEMGNLLAFMFLWNMISALVLLPAFMAFIMRYEPAPAKEHSERQAKPDNHLIAIVALLMALAVFMSFEEAEAAETDSGTGVNMQWNNTVKYSAAWRVGHPSSVFLANPNTDDGTRNFRRGGIISNRIDLLSELDLSYKDVGARISGAAWYDALYHRSNNNDSPGTANPFSVPFNEFTSGARELHGGKAEILDAFIFGRGQLGNMPASFRVGRHTLLWGESLLLASNGISYGQAPLDVIKAISVPGTQSKELFMPVGQVSGQLTFTSRLSFDAYYQYQWRKSRLSAVGSYFSTADLLDEGGERLFISPPTSFFRGSDLQAGDSGQWGIAARYRSEYLDTDFGLYYLRFNEKLPQIYLRPGLGADPVLGKIGEYSLVYPEDIRLIGVSFGTNAGAANVAGELHVRRNTPLASTPQIAGPGVGSDPLYAVGNTVHAQISLTHVLPKTALWPTASIAAEIGGQHLSSITKNPGAFLPTGGRTAWGVRALFTPTYFQVIPNLDISIPIGLGYNPKGRAPIPGFNGGANKGGDVTIGITGEYEKQWTTNLRYTHYFGSTDFQPLRDRDFVTFSIQRTF